MELKKQIVKIKENLNNNKVRTKIIKNSGWLISDKIFALIIGVFVSAIIARYFGPENYGEYNYALSFISLFTALSTLGLETLTVKSIVDKHNDEGTILCTSLYLRVFGGTILTILSFIIIRILEPADTNLHILVLIMSLTMVFKALEVIEYWIQANQRAKISSIIRMAAYVISATFKLTVVLLHGSLVHYALIYTSDAIIVGGALLIAYFRNRENISKWKFNLKYAKYILSQSWYMILSGLMSTLYMRIDQVMLGSMMSTKVELGIYAVAVQIASMWYFVPMAIIVSFNPIIMSKKKYDEKSFLNTVQLLYNIVALIGVGFGIFILVFSHLIVNILFGPEYSKATIILAVSIWAGTFAMLGSARGSWLVCEGLQKYSMIYIGVGCIVNITLNYFLIPILGGYGAAIATLVSQIIAVVIIPLFIKKTRISGVMMLKAFDIRQIFLQIGKISKET